MNRRELTATILAFSLFCFSVFVQQTIVHLIASTAWHKLEGTSDNLQPLSRVLLPFAAKLPLWSCAAALIVIYGGVVIMAARYRWQLLFTLMTGPILSIAITTFILMQVVAVLLPYQMCCL